MANVIDGGLTFAGYLQPPDVPADPIGDAWRGLTGATGATGGAGPSGAATGSVTGADPTGVASSDAAFRAACAIGGDIDVPAGTYKVSGSAIALLSNTRLRGAGPALSIIRPEALTDGYIFGNTNRLNLAALAATPATSANQTDHGITIEGLGFDFSRFQDATACSFLLASKIRVRNVAAYNGLSYTAQGFSGFQFIGCDDVIVNDYTARNCVNAVDCWKGTTRVKISNVIFEGADNAGNGGLINWQGVGTQGNDFGHSDDLQVVNATFWLNRSTAALLDSFAGSVSSNITFTNCAVIAKTGATNYGVVGRGVGGAVRIADTTFTADTGAAMAQPVLLAGHYSAAAAFTGTNIITTQNTSAVLTISYPPGIDVGPGNWVLITDGAGGGVVGNGLTLNGWYPVTAVSGTPTPTLAGTVITVTGPAPATSTGTIAATTNIQGYWGSFANCSLANLTFDGVGAAGNDLVTLGGSGHRVNGITVTQNYHGGGTPLYRAIVAVDGTQDIGNTAPVASWIGAITGAAGTGALTAGWAGDNTVTYTGAGLPPTRGLQSGVIAGTLDFPAANAAKINLYSTSAGFGISANELTAWTPINSTFALRDQAYGGALYLYAGKTAGINYTGTGPVVFNATFKCGAFGANAATPSTKITITGSRGSATATVLASLLTALVTFGLITDSTTA